MNQPDACTSIVVISSSRAVKSPAIGVKRSKLFVNPNRAIDWDKSWENVVNKFGNLEDLIANPVFPTGE